MKVNDVKKLVNEIKNCPGDNEAMHALEDRLYESVLRAIAKGNQENPELLAKEALKTKKIQFERWCG